MAKKRSLEEELVTGLRRRGGHLPTKLSEAARKKRKKKRVDVAKNGATYE